MTNLTLAESYLFKVKARLKVLGVLFKERSYSDVVREAQEIVELALKGMLRSVGIDPPKWHDVGPVLREHATLFDKGIQKSMDDLVNISKQLRTERDFSFYGDEDFLPTEEYDAEDARQAISWAGQVAGIAEKVIMRTKK